MIKSSVGEDESPQLPAYKVIILGMTSVGKTKLLTRYKYNDYKDEGATTLVVDFTPVCKK
jgi:GTPase SAR1 family protein